MPNVIVKARQKGFWSASRFWPGGETRAEVTKEQLAELLAESHVFLVATEVKDEVKPEPVKPPESAPQVQQPQQQSRRK